ncbi:MAG: hypothetical protein IKY82_07275 [Alistipes sp.]|nr:hypothetical protein [Alistipes sp.]
MIKKLKMKHSIQKIYFYALSDYPFRRVVAQCAFRLRLISLARLAPRLLAEVRLGTEFAAAVSGNI